MRALYFGTYDRDYPRNAQVISALRRARVDVLERHVGVWEGRRHKWQAGAAAAARLAMAEAMLLRCERGDFDVVIVGYPGHLDLPAARRTAAGRPVVFNPLVSLFDTLVGDRGRFRAGSAAARILRTLDVHALRSAKGRTPKPRPSSSPASRASRATASTSASSARRSAYSPPGGRPPSRSRPCSSAS